MLLSNLIASHQETYADIQAKIEELQEQQRKIQAYLQQLGSVESQMVSAVQMLQEAIHSINEVCPDQLAEYQQTVTGLFSSPVAMLESSQPEPTPNPEPEPEQPSNETYKLREVISVEKMWWRDPLVNLGIESEIVFEWWHNNKKLTVYILGNTAEYIKVWGADIDNEMEDGSVTSPAELTGLWKWLIS